MSDQQSPSNRRVVAVLHSNGQFVIDPSWQQNKPAALEQQNSLDGQNEPEHGDLFDTERDENHDSEGSIGYDHL